MSSALAAPLVAHRVVGFTMMSVSTMGQYGWLIDRRLNHIMPIIASMGAGAPAYSTSKATLNALTCILAAELRGAGVLVNAICPGWVATDMGGPGGRPVAQGAAGIVWAATLPDDGPTGGFFRDGKRLPW